MRYEKSLFTNIQKRQNILKINLLFKKFTTFTGKNNSRIYTIKNVKFSGIVFIWTQTFREIFDSALVF